MVQATLRAVRSRSGSLPGPRVSRAGAEPRLPLQSSCPELWGCSLRRKRQQLRAALWHQLCCQLLPGCKTKRCQLPVTMKLQFRGALYLSGNKALALQAVSRALQIAQAPLLKVLFLLTNVGRENYPQPPAAAKPDVVETACETNGDGILPLPGAEQPSAKGLETQSLLPAPARVPQSPACWERREGVELTQHQPHVPTGPSTQPPGREG